MSYDLSAFRQTASGPYEQVIADARDSGRTVAGAEKLAQRFVTELLTRTGEVPGIPGCAFVDRLRAGNARTETDVFTALASAVSTVVTTLQAAETDGDADEERLTGVRIRRLEVDDNRLTLVLLLRTRAAVTPTVNVPLDFLLD